MKPGPWRKSSRSGGNQGQCVEARTDVVTVDVRDSKLGDASPILAVAPADWRGFLATVTR
ncbi:hypothetical protein Afil01_07620 [Actinorhabdospora filicis]|uniref:DUF397 domain-containing protein n=1 Tax=Actinorhabdospora filicis TaxID=1785913 RepID=A0A9W6SEZ2_9ACTN|nr:DUF397 domain-containing protein [Actinorhabdospora filicis]GLZ75955.1 hypothetical protein Afil01_07620 [Actinorhabdospora filicis]